jgi:uncharacterized repeat protein (TIGR03803 family)
VLHAFTREDGYFPRSGLTLDQAGNVYGTTVFGGTHGEGIVFESTRNSDGSWTESVRYNFAP